MFLLWQYRLVLFVLFVVLWDNGKDDDDRFWRWVHRAGQAACVAAFAATIWGCPTC